MAPDSASPRAALEKLRVIFEEFGLSRREADVLEALLDLTGATATELARRSGMDRANVYRVLESLNVRGVASPVQGDRRRWTTPRGDEVVHRLWLAEADRHRVLETRRQRALELVAQLGPERPAASPAYVHLLRSAAHLASTYERLLREVGEELLVLNRGPYGRVSVNHSLLAALARGVSARALYIAAELEDPALEDFRAALDVYHQAGVEGRVVDRLPVRMAVFDRRSVLVSLEDAAAPVMGSPTPLHIDHPEYAAAQALIFEHFWERSQPCPQTERVHDAADVGGAIDVPGVRTIFMPRT